MTNNRIKQIADFFYSSNSENDIPLRISVEFGVLGGTDLTKDQLIGLLKILSNSIDLRKDILNFSAKLK